MNKSNLIAFLLILIFTSCQSIENGDSDSPQINVPPGKPFNPTPTDNSGRQDTSVLLSWKSVNLKGNDLLYNVYFGTDIDFLPLVSSQKPDTAFTVSGLLNSKTYYWQVVAYNNERMATSSPIWRFTTDVYNYPPLQPILLQPRNESVGEKTFLKLKWECKDPNNDTLLYNVFFGTSENPVNQIINKKPEHLALISDLTFSTTYYWQVEAIDRKGAITTGPVWKFKTCDGTFTFNGFTYRTVIIGKQEWMIENLRSTQYNDGSPISKIIGDTAWANLKTGAFCLYDDSEQNSETYGFLYNWYAVNTGKLAPVGWRVPTNSDWEILENTAGGRFVAGEKLKSVFGWPDGENGNGTDVFGFSAQPGGFRQSWVSPCYGKGVIGYYWSSTSKQSRTSYAINFSSGAPETMMDGYELGGGFSVRLVRDL